MYTTHLLALFLGLIAAARAVDLADMQGTWTRTIQLKNILYFNASAYELDWVCSETTLTLVQTVYIVDTHMYFFNHRFDTPRPDLELSDLAYTYYAGIFATYDGNYIHFTNDVGTDSCLYIVQTDSGYSDTYIFDFNEFEISATCIDPSLAGTPSCDADGVVQTSTWTRLSTQYVSDSDSVDSLPPILESIQGSWEVTTYYNFDYSSQGALICLPFNYTQKGSVTVVGNRLFGHSSGYNYTLDGYNVQSDGSVDAWSVANVTNGNQLTRAIGFGSFPCETFVVSADGNTVTEYLTFNSGQGYSNEANACAPVSDTLSCQESPGEGFFSFYSVWTRVSSGSSSSSSSVDSSADSTDLCQGASVSQTLRTQWIANGVSFYLYDISVVNSLSASLAQVPTFSIASVDSSTLTFSQSWNLALLSSESSNSHEVALPAGTSLGSQQSYTSAGYVANSQTVLSCSAGSTAGSTSGTPAPSTTGSASVSSSCSASVTISVDGAAWQDAQGRSTSVYRITLTNTGTKPLKHFVTSFTFTGDLTSTWNLSPSLGGYEITNFGGSLAPGASYNSAGMIISGATSVIATPYGAAC